MKIDVIVYQGGKIAAEKHRMDLGTFVKNLPVYLRGLLKDPEDFLAIRISKRQVGE